MLNAHVSTSTLTSTHTHTHTLLHSATQNHLTLQKLLKVSAPRMKKSISFKPMAENESAIPLMTRLSPLSLLWTTRWGSYLKALLRRAYVEGGDPTQSFSCLSSGGTIGFWPAVTQPRLAEERGWIIQSGGLWVLQHCPPQLAAALVKYWF